MQLPTSPESAVKSFWKASFVWKAALVVGLIVLAVVLSPTVPESAAQFVWIASLAVGLIVSLVVALLLWLIHREAGIINQRVAKIWEVGQRVACNTIQIPILYRINETVEKILARAQGINDGAAAIEAHAKGCPGCPHCMLDH